ncbi:hypothetical protein RRG08_023710 [Elysia crispata]|uniref:Fibrinogen C-terminal domain-containing protein n=1 Tax=Elysia crispata TaxID=231223 RepID=A0AAE0Z7T8_9GAST|nr:hypothetical protein RRG08_023710 [Elysia crispata]
MDKICLIIALCFALCCHGLEKNLNRDNPGLLTAQTRCGVLTCEERIVDINNSGRAKGLFSSIVSLKIFKRNTNKGELGIILGSVSTETPNLTLVTNHAKIFGVLDDKQAKIQVELFKPHDCQSDYSCQTLGVDSQGKKLSSIITLTQQGQTRSPVDIERWIDDKLEQIERSVHDVTESWNNFVLQYRIDHRLTSLQDQIELLETKKKVETEHTSLIAKISGRMGQIGSELQESLSNTILFFAREEQDNIPDNSQGCKEIGGDLATTVTAFLGSMNRGFGQIRDSAHENLLALAKQIKSINESVVSTNASLLKALNTTSSSQHKESHVDSNVKDNHKQIISGLKDIVSEVDLKVVIVFQTIMMDLFRPKVCEKGMVAALSHVSYPYPVIYPSSESKFQFPYLCDSLADAGGWIVIQRRSTGNVDFHRTWVDYRNGFGYLDDDFWLGNDNIFAITRTGKYELRVDLRYQGKSAFAQYSQFSVSSELSKFTLRVENYSGTAGNSLSYHNNCAFTTFDRDNDPKEENCAARHRGGWWFNQCDTSNLNGDWRSDNDRGMEWDGFVDPLQSVDFSEMKIRKVG